MEKPKYWIIVASKDHASAGRQQGIVQANHGKAAPLERMKINDWVVIYSSKNHLAAGDKYQKFTAIGQVKDGEVYQVEVSHNFKPFRRNINYYDCKEAAILPMIDKLEFIENKKQWGYPFRYGFFEINEHDFGLISAEMLEKVEQDPRVFETLGVWEKNCAI